MARGRGRTPDLTNTDSNGDPVIVTRLMEHFEHKAHAKRYLLNIRAMVLATVDPGNQLTTFIAFAPATAWVEEYAYGYLCLYQFDASKPELVKLAKHFDVISAMQSWAIHHYHQAEKTPGKPAVDTLERLQYNDRKRVQRLLRIVETGGPLTCPQFMKLSEF